MHKADGLLVHDQEFPEDKEIPQEALEAIDTSVPEEYLREVMATQLMEHLSSYHASVEARRAARQVGDSARSEQLGRQVAFYRSAIGLIQHQYEGIRTLADEIMQANAKQIRQRRRALLADEEA